MKVDPGGGQSVGFFCCVFLFCVLFCFASCMVLVLIEDVNVVFGLSFTEDVICSSKYRPRY